MLSRAVLLSALIFCLLGDLQGIHVKIYRDRKFKGLIYDEEFKTLEWPNDCHTIKSYAQGLAGSLKTDTCLILYESPGCTGNSFKVSRDMTAELEELGKQVFSFHPCNDTFGGSTIRVDLFDTNSQTLVKYQDICGCQDLPSQVSTKAAKLNNYGNCIRAYPTDSCSGEYKDIPAGRNGLTENLPELGFYPRSLSACGSRRNCVRLASEVFKFVLLPDSEKSSVLSEPKKVNLATKTMFYNNGSATVIQEYEAVQKTKESSSIELTRSFYQMTEVTVSGGVNGSAGVEGYDTNSTFGKVSGKASGYLNMAYSASQESLNQETNTYSHEEEKEFAVRQSIEVPPCTRYEVSSVVEVVENYPMFYEVYAKVTGESGGEKLTAEDVSTLVDDLTFVEIYDEYTAVFKSTHSLVASVGVEAKISGEGSKIEGCDG